MKTGDTFQLICLAWGFPAPEKEYRFYPPRKWRVDYAWPRYKLAVEVEGGVWIRGRHIRPIGFLKDLLKYNTLAMEGYILFRFTPQEMGTKGIATIDEWFRRYHGIPETKKS